MVRAFKKIVAYILRHEWIYRLLIMIPTLPEDSIVYLIRERCQTLRLRNRGKGGYLQDTHIRYPHNISIGDRVTCGGRVFINGLAQVSIGNDCLIAYGAKIISATHDPTSDIMNRKTVSKPINIGNNVWIGAGSIILPGVTLGPGIVVGAGAVVTKSFHEPDMVLLGTPAKPHMNRKNHQRK